MTDASDRLLLGVGPDATSSEIINAYRRRIRDVHPDLGTEDDQALHELMADLADARRRLLSEDGDPEGPRAPTVVPTPWVPSRDAQVSARTVQRTVRLFVLAAIIVAVVLVVFSVIAFSQSG